MKECSLVVKGTRLFNAVPRELREFVGELNTFKIKLDQFLSNVPDRPALDHYYQSARNNDIIAQLNQVTVESLYNV